MVVLALLIALLAHSPFADAQDAAPAEQLRLRGQVVADDHMATPLLAARVTVLAGGQAAPPAASNRDGIFEVLVPAGGDWSVRVTKAGYAPVELSAGDLRARGTRIPLPRGAVVTGRVVDGRGAPVPAATVRVRPAVCADPCPAGTPSAAVAANATFAETDDLGEYRAGSLPAGRYEVTVVGSRVVMLGSGSAAVEVRAARAAIERVAIETVVRVDGVRVDGVLPGLRGEPTEGPHTATVQLRSGEETALHLVREGEDRDVRNARAYADGFNAGAAAGRGTAPPGDAAASEPRPAALRGRVSGPAGFPLAAARVQLLPLDGIAAPRVSATDGEGRYELANVPPGTYRLAVSKPGFTAMEYGQQRAEQQGTTIVARGGETIEGLDVRLAAGSIISGRVVDAHGEPLEGVTVSVLQSRFTGGRTVVVPVTDVAARRTDDRGQYRLYGLLPGTYYVAASPAATEGGVRPADNIFSVGSAVAVMAAAPVNADQPTSTERNMTIFVSASPPALTPAGTVYHPAATGPGDAVPVRLAPGFDAYGIDITVTPPSGARVRGTAVDSRGEPVRSMVRLTVSHRSGAPIPPARSATAGSDGTFEFTHVPPGDYVVQTMSSQMTWRTTNQDRSTPGRPAGTIIATTRMEVATQFVTVGDAGEVSVSLRTAPGHRVTGQVVVEGATGSPGPVSFAIEAIPADPDHAPLGAPRRATPDSSGTFTLQDVFGPQRLALWRSPAGWYLKSAFVNGIDAADYPVSFDGTTPAEVRVVVARGGEVAGRAVDDRREPAGDYSVVVFAADASRWYPQSRYLRLVRSSRGGEFRIGGLPPGEYWVAAVNIIDGDSGWGEWQDPAFLGTLVGGARRVSVAEGQTETTELRVMRLAR